jgi:hypothetical protein
MFPSLFLAFATVLFLVMTQAMYVEGVALLFGLSSLFVVVVLGISWLRRNKRTLPLTERPLDFICVAGFVAFAVIAILVDAVQAGNGPGKIDPETSLGPKVLKEAFSAWVKDCDPLLGANPLWYTLFVFQIR